MRPIFCKLISISAVSFIAVACLTFGPNAMRAYTAQTRTPAKSTPAVPAPKYVGSDTCAQCHQEQLDKLGTHWHGQAQRNAEKQGKGYLCEGCHGPGSQHADDPTAQSALPLKQTAKNGTGCLSCHNTKLSPVKWRISEHARGGTTCLACHGQAVPTAPAAMKEKKPAINHQGQPIDPHGNFTRKPSTDQCLACHGEKRAEMALPSHHPLVEQRLTCTDCHNTHAPMTGKMKNELCVACHVKQRGPFRFAHGAISGHLSDACLDCHRPHGSPNQKLLKFSSRGLCLQCHANKATHFAGRTCWDCHTGIHGSNSSALFLNNVE